MTRLRCLSVLACTLLATSPLLAQQDRQRTSSDARDIVVTGELPPQREVTRQARAITATSNIRHYPLPLFGDRLCPGVFGMKGDYAALIIDRIRANAERFDLWMSEDDGSCTPNLIVAFVDDGQAVLQQVSERRHWLFQGMPRHERLELLAEGGPVRVWAATGMRTRDGMSPVSSQTLGDGALAVGNPATGPQTVQLWSASSRLFLPVREDITWVLVLFDRDDVRDKTLLQLADYATMRGLARTRPVEADGATLDTILALFDPSAEPPAELTQFDRAYLGAIYRGLPNLVGITKVHGVNREMRRQAEQAAAVEARAVDGEARSPE